MLVTVGCVLYSWGLFYECYQEKTLEIDGEVVESNIHVQVPTQNVVGVKKQESHRAL